MSASYPGSVKIFASRSNGQTIDASHVGDLQDEVNAIEAGLLNGTANLNSSNSTIVNLSVTGNSTFVGNVTVTGTLTLAGAQSFSTIVTANQQPRCVVYNGSTQSIGNNTETALTFNSQDINIGAMHSTGTTPTRVTVQSTGLFLAMATVVFSTSAANNREYLWFRKNGATPVGSKAGVQNLGGGAYAFQISNQTLVQMSSTGDYLEAMVFQNSGGAQESGNASSRVDQNQLQLVKLW